jgi:hypothetical protein
VSPFLRLEIELEEGYVDSITVVPTDLEMNSNISDGHLPRYAKVTN